MKKAKSIKAGKSRKSQQEQSPVEQIIREMEGNTRMSLGKPREGPSLADVIAQRGVLAEIAEPTSPIAEHRIDRPVEPGYVLQGAQIAMMALIWGALCFTVGAVVQAAVFGS